MSEPATARPALVIKKERSPTFPFITLTRAVERVRSIYDAARRHEVRMGDVAHAMGYGPKSSGTIQTVAALISYGLLDDSGAGETRKFKVSDLGFKILEDQRPGAREAALREAAVKPRSIAEHMIKWEGGRPSDAICISELRMESGYTEDGARVFLKVFDDALTYAGGPVSGKKPDAGGGSDSVNAPPPILTKAEVGDLIQWEADGVLRLPKPVTVRAIQEADGNSWVFVEGSETGIPMEQVVIEQKAGALASKSPTLPLPARPDAVSDDMDVDRFTTDEGVVRIEFPKAMSADSVEELETFFNLFIKKAKRRAGIEKPKTTDAN